MSGMRFVAGLAVVLTLLATPATGVAQERLTVIPERIELRPSGDRARASLRGQGLDRLTGFHVLTSSGRRAPGFRVRAGGLGRGGLPLEIASEGARAGDHVLAAVSGRRTVRLPLAIRVVQAEKVGGASRDVDREAVPRSYFVTSLDVAPGGPLTPGETVTIEVGFNAAGAPGATLTFDDPALAGGAELFVEGDAPPVELVVGEVASPRNVTITASAGGESISRTVALEPTPEPGPASLLVETDVVRGGDPFPLRIGLTAPAGPDGLILELSTDRPDLVTPKQIGVPAGAQEVQTYVGAPASDRQEAETATVTVSGGGASASVEVEVLPTYYLTGLGLSIERPLVEGDTVTVVVSLNGAAAPGAWVEVSDPVLGGESSFFIPGGNDGRRRDLVVGDFGGDREVTITASAGGESISRQVSLMSPTLSDVWVQTSPQGIAPVSEIDYGINETCIVAFTLPAAAPRYLQDTVQLSVNRPDILEMPPGALFGARDAGESRSAVPCDVRTPVAEPTELSFTATYQGVSRTATVTLRPTEYRFVEFGPPVSSTAPIVAGNPLTLRLRLLPERAAEGLEVALSSDDPQLAPVPATLAMDTTTKVLEIVPGDPSALGSFPAPVTVTASVGEATRSYSFSVYPRIWLEDAAPADALSSDGSVDVAHFPGGEGWVNYTLGFPPIGSGVDRAEERAAAEMHVSTSDPAIQVPSVVVPEGSGPGGGVHFQVGAFEGSRSADITLEMNGISRVVRVELVNPTLEEVLVRDGFSGDPVAELVLTSGAGIQCALRFSAPEDPFPFASEWTDEVQMSSSRPDLVEVPPTATFHFDGIFDHRQPSPTEPLCSVAPGAAVEAPTLVEISATWQGQTRTATVTLTPEGG